MITFLIFNRLFWNLDQWCPPRSCTACQILGGVKMCRKLRNRKLFIYRKKNSHNFPRICQILNVTADSERPWKDGRGEAGAAQFEGPKRVYLMKISKKLNYMLTCIFSDGNAKPNPILFSERRSETRIFKSW